MCNCGNCGDSIISNPAGADGLNGEFGGYSSIFKYSVTTTPPPTVGFINFNNSDPLSITKVYVSTTNHESIDVTDFLASLDNNGNFGYIRIFKEFESETFYLFEITSVSNGGSYYELGVNYLGHSFYSTPTSGDKIVLTFAPAGPQGPKGNTGDQGIQGIQGPAGPTGPQGDPGEGGILYQSLTIPGTDTRFFEATTMSVANALTFLYPGSNFQRTPSNIKIIAKTASAGAQAAISVTDLTNGLDWVSSTVFTPGTTEAIINLGTPTNIDTDPSIIMVSISTITPGVKLTVYSMMIDFT